MKHALSRLISLMLILCLVLPAALAEASDAASAPAEQINARFLFSRSGEIYGFTYDGMMYRRLNNSWLPAGSVYDDVWAISADGDSVWFLIRREDENRAWYEISPAMLDGQGLLTGVGDTLEINWDVDADNWPQFYGFVVEDSMAYIAVNSSERNTRLLYRVDLSDGKAVKLLNASLQSVTRYKDGLLLAQRDDRNGETQEIITIDPGTGGIGVIAQITGGSCSGLIYDPESDAVYFSNQSYVYRVDGDTAQPVGYLALRGANGRDIDVVIREGRYCFNLYDDWVESTIDPTLLPKRTLRLQSSWQISELILAFAQQHPEIAVEYAEGSYDGLEAFTRVMQADSAPDVFFTSLGRDFITLRDRKYLTDMSSEALVSVVSRMAPNITKDVLVDGRLYALPYALDIMMNGYFLHGLEKAGLTAEDVPTSYEGLLDFIERWHEDYFEENEGMELFEYCADMRQFLFSEIYAAQLRACQSNGELTLDTPAVRSLLTRLEELTPVINEVAPPRFDDEDSMSGNALFTDMVEAGVIIREYPFDEMYSARPMPLSLDSQSDPTINAHLNLMVINPYSPNASIAVTFLEFIAENLPVVQKVAMMPEENDPIERMNYEDELQRLRDRAALWEQRLADAPEENRADIEDELRYVRYEIKDYEENRWAMTAEEVLWYRENIAPYLTFTTVTPYSANTADQLYSLQQRYLDGQASLDEFISRFEEIVWMMRQENQ